MIEMGDRSHEIESSFDINDVSFENVSQEFERKFRKRYRSSLDMMSDTRNKLTNASGANSLDILEKMARRISEYNRNADFDDSYHQLEKEYEPFTET